MTPTSDTYTITASSLHVDIQNKIPVKQPASTSVLAASAISAQLDRLALTASANPHTLCGTGHTATLLTQKVLSQYEFRNQLHIELQTRCG